ncbi:MAG: hypothetical protein IPN95_18095 [Bacteroidetes bacterium]|nr:hypothetical protein [Bacteroidota bacterium]
MSEKVAKIGVALGFDSVSACTFNYRFGKSLVDHRKHNSGNADTEKKRVKG